MSDCTCNIALPPRLLRGVTRTVRVTVVDKNNNPVDLTVARNVVVTVALDGAGRSEAYVPGISIQGDDNNVVEFPWYADVQRRCGRYTIDINADFGNRNQSRVDFHREFGVELVEHSCDVSEEPAEAMEVDDDLDLEGTLEVTTDGMSAFDQWRTSPESEGYPPTEEGFFAWIRQPATDAAADVEAGEAARNAAEAQRVAAEQAREAQAESDHSRAASDHTTAASDHSLAASDHVTAGLDHTQAVSDHDTAAADHTTAGSDHTKAVTDHTTAASDHTVAVSDHEAAAADHSRAASDHTTAGQDHTQAGQDHTTAGTDHTRADSDHSRAESDHTRAEQDHEAMQNVVPTPSPSDEGKVLTVTDDEGTLGWEEPAGGDVDQTYDATSQNAQSGVAMAGALEGKQDTIADLPNIRAGAAAGATAYQKPQNGIPASDLADGVIPTVPTDVVKYTSQSLTDAQQTQARNNIGASKPELLVAEYNVTPFATVITACLAGKNVIVKKNENYKYVVYSLTMWDGDAQIGGTVKFSRINYSSTTSGTIDTISVDNVDGWKILESIPYQESFFIAQYGVTHWSEVLAAYKDGKVLLCRLTTLAQLMVFDPGFEGDDESEPYEGSAAFIYYDPIEKKLIQLVIDGSTDEWQMNRLRYVSDFDGRYASLSGQPTIPDVTGKADKVLGATSGHLAALDSNGNLADSGKSASDFATAAQGAKADTAYQKPATGIPASDLADGVIPTVPTDVVKYTSQTLTTEQKTQARTNIGAGTYSKPSGGIPASDIAPGVIPAGVTVDQTYDPTSQNAQSGVAMAGALAGKQDVISDLSTIRSGASAGATAYQKPSTGIPASDMASGVIPTVPAISTDIAADATSDTKTASPKAVKTFVEGKGYTTNVGTVTGVTVGSTAYTPSNGVVTIPAYPSVPVTDVTVGGTSVVSSGTAAVPAIPTVPTISTDIQTDKSSTTKTASPSAVYNEVHPAVESSQPNGGFLPNVVYDLGTLTGTVTFSLASASDATIANAYFWTFETSSTAPTINWPSGLNWHGGAPPDPEASKHYEIMVRNGYANALVFDLTS